MLFPTEEAMKEFGGAIAQGDRAGALVGEKQAECSVAEHAHCLEQLGCRRSYFHEQRFLEKLIAGFRDRATLPRLRGDETLPERDRARRETACTAR